MSTDEDTTIPDDFDLMAWIESGTVATRTVKIHNNPALVAEAEALQAELAAAEKAIAETGGEGPLGAADPRPGIEERMRAVSEAWDESCAEWTVRAIAYDDIERLYEAVPHPKQPAPPPATAGDKAREKYAERMTAWGKAVAAADRERTLHYIATAVTAVETTKGRIEREVGAPPIVTIDALRALRDRPHGEQWVGVIPSGRGQRFTGLLASAVMEATEGDQDIPRPPLPGRSTTLPG